MSMTKRYLEEVVENNCTCGAGCTFEIEEHEPDCGAMETLKQIAGPVGQELVNEQ